MASALQVLVGVGILLSSGWLLGEELPPLGKRAYIIDSVKFYDLTEIVPEGSHDKMKPFLKDPIFASGIKVAKGLKQQQVVGKSEKYRPAQLQFKFRDVKGRYAVPRVSFTRREIPLNRVDESQSSNNISKIFKSAAELDIDL